MKTGVVIPAHNAEQFIVSAVESVLMQTCSDTTIVIVDDASTDRTADAIMDLERRDLRVNRLALPEQSGAAAARNAGLSFLDERFVAFLDADDMWYPTKLEQQLRVIQETSTALTYSGYDVVKDGNGNKSSFVPPSRICYEDLLKSCSIGTSTVVIDRDRVGDIRMPPLKRAQDYATWLGITKKYGPVIGLSECLALYRILPGSVSRNKLKKARYQWIVYRKHERLTVPSSVYYLMHYAYRGLTKY